MKKMNHADYQNSLRNKTDDQLRFIAQDAREAAEAMPQGENAGFYLDEVHYCGMELARRAKA